jgi:hypothetical protein
MPGPAKGHGSGIFSKLANHEERIKKVEGRLDGHDDDIAEIDTDVLTLTNVSTMLTGVCARASRRIAAREKLAKIRARVSKRSK